jgi:hypothetical protein
MPKLNLEDLTDVEVAELIEAAQFTQAARQLMKGRDVNRIIRVELAMDYLRDQWIVSLTKGFDSHSGGGQQMFRESGGVNIHRALDVARSMITVSAARRTDLEAN